MAGLTLGIVLQAALMGGGNSDYQSAYKEAQTSGRPLVVLVSADWCPACQTLKSETLQPLKQTDEFKQVSYAVVNPDQEPQLARQLMSGGTIPQLIVYTKTDQGWKRKQLTGFQSRGTVTSFIQRALRLRR